MRRVVEMTGQERLLELSQQSVGVVDYAVATPTPTGPRNAHGGMVYLPMLAIRVPGHHPLGRGRRFLRFSVW